MTGWPKASPRYAEYVRKLKACGHWYFAGLSRGEHDAILRHRRTGRTVSYPSHDGGNEYNGARNFAAQAGQICGCTFVEHRGRKRSRKVDRSPRFITTRETQKSREVGERFDQLRARYIELIDDARDNLDDLGPVREALRIERELRQSYQPCPTGGRWISELVDEATRPT